MVRSVAPARWRIDPALPERRAAEPATRIVEPSLTSGERGFERGTILSISRRSIAFAARVFHRFRPLRDFLGERGELRRAVALGVRPFCESLSFTSGSSTMRLISAFIR